MKDIMIKTENLTKEYKLGQIGGTTLKEALQRLKAKILKREDPTRKIGAKNYNKGEKFNAISNLSIEIKRGEKVGIIGHNGAGKTTLLKLISQITAPTNGQIYLNGRVASMLEIGTGFHPDLTGRENIYMNGAILGMTKKEIDAKIEDIIDFSEIREFIDTPVKRYSSGMYVKLAFSVAVHLDSEITIMDEVLAVGDIAFQQKSIDKLKSVAEEEDRTVLFVSHNMNTIRSLCDRVIVLEEGKLVFDGDVEEGILKYVGKVGENAQTKVDFSLSPRPTKNHGKKLFINSLEFSGKNSPSYLREETPKILIKFTAKEDMENINIALVVKGEDGTPIGLSQTTDGKINVNKDKDYSLEIKLSLENLAQGRYFIEPVLYSIDSAGNYLSFDHPLKGAILNIASGFDGGVRWIKKTFGSVNLSAPEIINLLEE